MNSRSAIQRDALRTSITFFTVTSSPVPQVFRTPHLHYEGSFRQPKGASLGGFAPAPLAAGQ